ncbi:MAG TPA: pyridoxal-phosphate dependent enzyme [Syntrophales bacterium]|nr:pyridoxal-phosphate dependent enzyme [Syntrophales bacterium]
MITLFERYPRLAERLPRLVFGEFPTPVEKLSGLCHRLDRDNLYIKRDDLSSRAYGGNKVRKLEFLLADALKNGAGRVITSGGAGSNHALATALYAQQAGLKAVLMLYQQPNSHAVMDNLLMDLYSGAKLFHHDSYEEHLQAFKEVVKWYEIFDGRVPYVIPLGGSSSVGAIGYVNAGFELADQIDAGKLPVPSRIYLALGTMGTTAGLLLGLKAAGIKTHLYAARVVPTYVADIDKYLVLFHQTNELVRELDPSLPLCNVEPDDITIYHGYFGDKYGMYTPEAMAAMKLLRESDGIVLDGTYTGKACAAFLEDARNGDGEPLLFWNTKNSRPFPSEALAADYKLLPSSFHRYFTMPVQSLDEENYLP